MSKRVRMECNDCSSDDDNATEDEKEKTSVDFDCENGVHNRGMKSKCISRHLFENCFVDSLESRDESSIKEKLDVFTWKKRVPPCGENFPGISKECTAISAKNNGQRHCRPAAESEMALAAKSHQSKSEVIHDHENNDNEEEFDDNLIFADGFDDQDMERPSFTQPTQHPTIPMVLSEPGVQPVIQIPATINRYLRDYQRDGVHFLYQHFSENTGAILGDDMGLGKTVQVIAFIAAVLGKTGTKADVFYQFMDGKTAGKQKDSICKVSGTFLIVSPGSVMYNWKEELETWGHFKMGLFHGNTKEDTLERTLRERLDVALTTYETMRNHLDDVNKVQWLAVIMDEVHRLKDPKSQITVAAKALRAKRRYGLTGTPLQNKLAELWCVLDWANPGSLGKSKRFTREFDKPIREGQTFDATKRELALSRKKSKDLHDMIRKFFLRRTKDLIANQLPYKDELVVFCPLTPFQEDVYQTLLQTPDVELITKKNFPCDCGSGVDRGKCCYKFSSDNEDIKTVTMRYFQLLLKVANHAALLAPRVKQTLDQQERAKDLCLRVFARYPEFSSCSDLSSFEVLSNPKYCGKMKVLDKLLRMFRQEHCKVLLFSRSTQLLNILEEFVISQGLVYSRLDGGTKPSERTRLVRDFNLDPNIFLSLISTKAGGLGLNFTGANVVVIFDPDWNPSSDLQAQDRAYRIGQRRDVRVYRLISSGTIEEMIYLRQVYKQQLANLAIKGTNERRYFTGIEGDRERKGELFGLENLFSYRAEGASLSKDILNRTEKLEAGYEVAKYQIAHEKMREDRTLKETTGDNGLYQKNDKDPYNLEEMASQFIDDEELPALRLNKVDDEPWKNFHNTADTQTKGIDTYSGETSMVVDNNAASWNKDEDLLCQKRSILAKNSKGTDLLQNKLPSVEDFFISQDDVMEPEIAVDNQKSAEKLLCPDTGDPVSVIPLTAENGSSSFNLGNKLNNSNIKRYTKVKRKGRNNGRKESLDIVPSTITFNQCVVEDSCPDNEHSVVNKAVASEISSSSENEESSEGLFSRRSRISQKRNTKTSFVETSKILKEGRSRLRRFPGKRVTNKSVNRKGSVVKHSKSINTVEQVLESCGVRYTHANRHVVGPSKAEDHMSKQALKDVFELQQFSQQPANCLPALETSDESDDLGEISWGTKQQEEKVEDRRTKDVTITLNRSVKTRSSCSSSTVERIGNNTVFIGSTPRGIRREHFREMSDQLGFSSEIDMAEAVVKSTSIERRMMLKQFYVDRNSDLSGLSCFLAPEHETEVVAEKEKQDFKRVKRSQDKQLAVKCNDTVAKAKRKKRRPKVKFRKEDGTCKGRDEKQGGRRTIVDMDQSGVKRLPILSAACSLHNKEEVEWTTSVLGVDSKDLVEEGQETTQFRSDDVKVRNWRTKYSECQLNQRGQLQEEDGKHDLICSTSSREWADEIPSRSSLNTGSIYSSSILDEFLSTPSYRGGEANESAIIAKGKFCGDTDGQKQETLTDNTESKWTVQRTKDSSILDEFI